MEKEVLAQLAEWAKEIGEPEEHLLLRVHQELKAQHPLMPDHKLAYFTYTLSRLLTIESFDNLTLELISNEELDPYEEVEEVTIKYRIDYGS